MVPADSDKIPRVSPYSGSHWAQKSFRLQGLHLLWLAFQCHSPNRFDCRIVVLQPQLNAGLGCSRFARRY